jgi:protein-S-isoprenylcysteine O-methyltransferase Ste14
LIRTRGAVTAPEKVFDGFLAASIAFWGISGLLDADRRGSPVIWAIAALHLSVAYRLLRRDRALRRAPFASVLLSLPALTIAGYAYTLGAPLSAWSTAAKLLFVGGTLLTLYAFSSLGRHFAVLPAIRGVTTTGPYQWVRHPAYGGELMMVVACALSRPTPLTAAVAASALPLLGLRIGSEEALLRASHDYRDYARRVRYRLIPGVW